MNNFLDIITSISIDGHKDQFRRDGITPYITHPLEVQNIVKNWVNNYLSNDSIKEEEEGDFIWNLLKNATLIFNDDRYFKDLLFALAVSHDLIEDAYEKYNIYTIKTMLESAGISQQLINFYVVALIAITKSDSEKYVDYIQRVRGNEFARIVKIADITHNISTLDPIRDKHKIDKYSLAKYILLH